MLEKRTLCNRDCPDTCAIVARIGDDGEIIRLTGDPNHPVTQGFLCARTALFLERQTSFDRLKTPLLRKGSELFPVSWDEALDVAARTLGRIRAESGPAAIFHYRSGGSLGLLGLVVDAFFATFGPVTAKRGDICSGGGDAAQELDFGLNDSNDLFDLENSKTIVLWGKNAFVSSPHTLTVVRRARKRGARIVVIDPVFHRTVESSDRFIQPKPGRDADLAMAVAAILLEMGALPPEALQACANWEGYRSLFQSHSVDAWCQSAEVARADAEFLAECYRDRPCATLVGWGMARRVNGASIVRAIDALGAISGNLGISGGGVSYYFRRRAAFDLSFRDALPPAPRSICEPLFGEEVLSASDPPIRAVWIGAGNPVAMLPDSAKVARALESREFVVVLDSFLTDTARRAHLVLPTPTLLEADDLLGAYGHHFVGVAEPVVAPPPGVKSDLDVINELALRLGVPDWPQRDAAWWKNRMVEKTLGAHGITLDRLKEGVVRNPQAPRVLFADRKFMTPSGKVELMTEAAAPSEDVPGFPLFLLSLSTEWAQSSQWARELEDVPVVTLHPDAGSGVPEGARAILESAVGQMFVRIRYDSRQRRDVVIVPKGGHFDRGHSANAITRARLTDHGEGGALYDERVRIVPIRS